MRLQRDDHAVLVTDRTAKLLNLVGMNVDRRNLHRGLQIKDEALCGRLLDFRHHRFANLASVIKLRAGEILVVAMLSQLGTKFLAASLSRKRRLVSDLKIIFIPS